MESILADKSHHVLLLSEESCLVNRLVDLTVSSRDNETNPNHGLGKYLDEMEKEIGSSSKIIV